MNVLKQITKTVDVTKFTVAKHSPMLLTAAGVVGVFGTAYFTWHATKKLETLLTEHETKVANGEELTTMEKVKDIAAVVALPAATAVMTISAFVASFVIQDKRIKALATSLTMAIANDKRYRAKVMEVLGEGVAKEIQAEVTKDIATEAKEAADEGVISEKDVRLAKSVGMYYELSSEYYRDDHDYNVAKLESVRNRIDHVLHTRGYLTMNEVYDMLGFRRTKIGAITGWSCSHPIGFDWNVINFLNDSEHFEPTIWLSWNQPQYVYDNVEYSGRYAL